MKRSKFALALPALLSMFATAPLLAHAADPYLGLEYARGMGLPDLDIRLWLASMIRAAMGFMGLVLVMQIMWGGFLMMTHGGSEENRKAAIGTIQNAVIGMVIIMTSASAANFVVNAIVDAATRTY